MDIKRSLFLAAGFGMLAFGFAGTILPLLPATPFFLGAAWSFSRSSPRLERWLHGLPMFGEGIQLWRSHRAISMTEQRIVGFGCEQPMRIGGGLSRRP